MGAPVESDNILNLLRLFPFCSIKESYWLHVRLVSTPRMHHVQPLLPRKRGFATEDTISLPLTRQHAPNIHPRDSNIARTSGLAHNSLSQGPGMESTV